MYLSELKLWNFRKYGLTDFDLGTPHLVVPFCNGLNVLIGENDSGKTAILDAIKLVLKTHAYEWIKIEKEDFFKDSTKLRIELFFRDLSTEEAKNFIEWLGWEGEGDEATPMLRLIYEVEIKNSRIQPADIKAGMDNFGYPLNAEARYYLKTTYLKALRDADTELIAKKNSRVSQILKGHNLFKEEDDNPHDFIEWFSNVNSQIKEWFENNNEVSEGQPSNKAQIKDIIDKFLQDFINDSVGSKLSLTNPDIKSILEKISIGIDGATNLGLGTMNRLFMATELLHLKRDWNGLKLCLIEELEAHLHPQAQMKVVESLLKESEVQFILTTHSPNLASKVPVENLIICKENQVYSLAKGKTKLEDKNLKYLKRFLDVTKSNLFFAKGVIIVEGWSEEILIPELAKKIGYDLTKHEVSIVNVGSTAYLHFAKILLRADDSKMKIPVSIVIDLDVRPKSDGTFDDVQKRNKEISIRSGLGDLSRTNITLNIAKEWTLEWCLFKSEILSELFKKAVKNVHSRTKSFKMDEDGYWNPNFENALIDKLSKSSGKIDKVAVANELAELISTNELSFKEDDEYLSYLISAIKHACRIKHGD